MWIMLAIPLGVAALAGIVKACEWYADARDTAAAITPEDKRQVVLDRLIRRNQWEQHPDPVRAACDDLRCLEDIERFRRWACATYLRTGQPIRALRDEWLKANRRTVIAGLSAKFGNDRATVARYNATLAEAIKQTPAEDIFIYEPARSKWNAADATFWQEHAAFMQELESDPIADHVAEAAFAAGRRL